MIPIVTTQEMVEAEARVFATGTDAYDTMVRAGRAVAGPVMARWAQSQGMTVGVLIGAGNNGGDGIIAAATLAAAGYRVRCASVEAKPPTTSLGARAWAEHKQALPALEHADATFIAQADILIDALFGIGLNKPLPPRIQVLIEVAAGKPVIAIDIPSGLDGNSGIAQPTAFRAVLTITFDALKYAHVLSQGRAYCGQVVCAEVGLKGGIQRSHGVHLNTPDMWVRTAVHTDPDAHKYTRGHAVVSANPAMAGAAILAARSAARAGAGMVRVLTPASGADLFKTALISSVIHPYETDADFAPALDTVRTVGALIIGCGGGATKALQDKILAARRRAVPMVIDADGVRVLAGMEEAFRTAPPSAPVDESLPCVLTPHAGEFAALFPDIDQQDRIAAARTAAARMGCVVVFKGPSSVIATAQGEVVVNTHDSPYLATAGSGDCLAGIIGGFMARAMPPFLSACAACWCHGDVARRHGIGLIADDIPSLLGHTLRTLQQQYVFCEHDVAHEDQLPNTSCVT